MLSIAQRRPRRRSWFNNERGNRKTFASLAFRPLGGGAAPCIRRRLRCVLAQQLSAASAGCRTARPNPSVDREAAEFRRALEAGETPSLHPFVFTTDYSPGDIATLLQSGGVELLDVKTLVVLRQMESVIRWGLSDMQRYQKLSDEVIVPNLDQDISFFYDPATRKLRKRFEIYPQALEATVKFAHDLDRTKTELLKQIQAERQRQH